MAKTRIWVDDEYLGESENVRLNWISWDTAWVNAIVLDGQVVEVIDVEGRMVEPHDPPVLRLGRGSDNTLMDDDNPHG